MDTRDSSMDTKEGYIFSIAGALAGIGGNKKFIKLSNSADYYLSYNDDAIILDLGYNAGVIAGLGQDILISDRFFLGGNSFRGFKQSGVGPRDSISNDSLGGNLFYTGSIKANFGIGLPPELGLKGNWFATFGSVTGIDKSTVTYFDDSSIRLSTGVGISWSSPFGPISIIVSQAILKEDYDITEALSFGVGTKF